MTTGVAAKPHKRATLEMNATALMASTVLTGALGIAFWVVAAHLIPAPAVGRASAALSAITFLAGLAQLNIISVFIRFVPGAGRATAGFIRRGYALAVATGLVLTSGFLAFGFARRFVGQDWFVPLGFLITAVLYSIFFVQDGALTALGAAMWVPVENLLFGMLRIVLLLGLTIWSQQYGAFLALTVPIVIAVAVVNWYIFRRLIPRHVAGSGPSIELSWKNIRGFVAADYAAGVIASCVALVPPVLVATVLGSTETAYFYIPWFIGVSFGTLVWNVVMAFVVESASDHANVPRHIRRAVRMISVVSLAVCALCFIGAPLILGTLGGTYATKGVTALRTIALAFPFTGVIIFYTGLCLVRKRLLELVIVQAVKVAIFLGLAAAMLRSFGIEGLAVIYLLCEAAASVALLPGAQHAYRVLTSAGHSGRPATYRSPRHAATVRKGSKQ